MESDRLSTRLPLHIETPLVDAFDISARSRKRIVLKMECYQPVGSFKLRGIGLLCQRSVEGGKRALVSSSGGNAGMAVAYSARRLGVKATVVVPASTPKSTLERLSLLDAEVIVHGEAWDDADAHARKLASEATAAYIPPFDHPTIWEGHASLVDEMAASGIKPDAIVLSVGGGGLLCGVLQGLERNGWRGVKVIAVETCGAESLHQSLKAGQLITLPAITSIAKSLGARRVANEALLRSQRHSVRSVVVSDTAALDACRWFAYSQRVLVEPACGAALAVVHESHASIDHAQCVAVVVCGGVSVEAVISHLRKYGSRDAEKNRKVRPS